MVVANTYISNTGTSTFSSNVIVDENLNLTGNLTAKTGKTATFVIASSDSLASLKAQADYVCDGVDDQVQIQEAIDALPTTGGKINFLEGIFHIYDTINYTKPIHLEGVGYNWHLNGGLTRFYPHNEIGNNPVFNFSGNWFVGEMTDIGFDGYLCSSKNGNMIELHANGGDFQINRCGFYYCPWQTIIHSTAHNIWIHDSFFESCGTAETGYSVIDIESGNRNRILNCHFRANKAEYCFKSSASENWILGSDFHDSEQNVIKISSPFSYISNILV